METLNEADFIVENKEVKAPNITNDESLQLYYDTKGKRNGDFHSETLLDMSGNQRHGELYNFAYRNLSGYTKDEGLVFDGVDDKLAVELMEGLSEDAFTYQLNNNIIAFDGNAIRWVKDGRVMERKGTNLFKDGQELKFEGYANGYMATDKIYLRKGHKYYVSRDYQKIDGTYNAIVGRITSIIDGKLVTIIRGEGENYQPSGVYTHAGESGYSSFYVYGPNGVGENGKKLVIFRNLQLIDLTETFGAGNEPTLEEIQAEPDKWQWLPNPMDLLEATELEGNILGDMENIVDDMVKDEQSGVEVFTDKADDSLVKVEFDGKSYQDAGSGKNLFNITKTTPYNMSSVIKEGEWYVANNGTYGGIIFDKFKTKIGKTYTISFTYKSSDNSGHYTITNVPGSALSGMKYNSNKGLGLTADGLERRGSITFTADADEYISISLLRTGTSGSISYKDIQIEEDSTATSYEPPAPNPNYPIEIHSLSDFDVVSSVGGKNLMLNSDLQLDFSVDNAGESHSLSTEARNHGMRVSEELKSLRGQSVTISYEYNAFDFNKVDEVYFLGFEVRIDMRDGYGWLRSASFNRPDIPQGNSDGWVKMSYTQKIPDIEITEVRPITWLMRGATGEVSIRNIKVERGTIATDWVPALEDITKSDNHPLINKINFSLSEPLRSAGDAKDRIFRDSDGLWKIERNVGKYVADGTESWRHWEAHSNGHRYDMLSAIPQSASGNLENALNTHLVADGRINNTDGVHSTWISGRSPRVVHFGINGSDELKSWMKSEYENGTPATWLYEVETPAIETLEQDLQDKLNNLRSFPDSNYVYTVINDKTDIISSYVSENLKPILHAKFLPADFYKENRYITNLLIWNRPLTNVELLYNYETMKKRHWWYPESKED